jgi:hypothetical protein
VPNETGRKKDQEKGGKKQKNGTAAKKETSLILQGASLSNLLLFLCFVLRVGCSCRLPTACTDSPIKQISCTTCEAGAG